MYVAVFLLYLVDEGIFREVAYVVSWFCCFVFLSYRKISISHIIREANTEPNKIRGKCKANTKQAGKMQDKHDRVVGNCEDKIVPNQST